MHNPFERQSLLGTTIGGRFKVLELIGEGASGEVYVAEHTDLGRRYALKVLKETVEADSTMVERFRREARAAGRLDHPNIVYISDFGRMDDGRLYLVMEYVAGKTLREEIEASPGHLLPRARALQIIAQTADALDAAHQAGVVHRDIKPGNLLLGTAPDGGDRIKILDFGLAKIMIGAEIAALTQRGEMFGTPAYMSPEQARGENIDAHTDIYALGVMAFELLTGRLPFVARSIPHMMLAHQKEPVPDPSTLLPPGAPPLPVDLRRIVVQCMAKQPENRPARALEVKQAIEGLDASEHSSTTTIPVVQNPAAYGLNAAAPQVDAVAPKVDPRGATMSPIAGVRAPQGGSSAEALQTVLDRHADGTTRRAWAMDQAGKIARSMAIQLVSFGLGGPNLQPFLGQINELEQRELELETEIAVRRSNLQEIEIRYRAYIAQLRYAVTDLSVERGRMVDAGSPDQAALLDIGYQIGELEKRLGEAGTAQESELAAVRVELQGFQAQLGAVGDQLGDADRRLVSVLYQIKPEPCPPQFLREYDALDLLMKAAFGV
ncbi:MAG: serine/threonine-protein kinase [bacterium]